jgi:hypothetical protein
MLKLPALPPETVNVPVWNAPEVSNSEARMVPPAFSRLRMPDVLL